MSRVPLSGDTKVTIFADEFSRNLAKLDHDQTCQVWNRLCTIHTSMAPTRRFIHEQVTGAEELEVIRVGDQLRIYCKLVDGVPDYEIINVFSVHKHDYRGWAPYDRAAQRRVEEIRLREEADDIDGFLARYDAHVTDAVLEIYERVCG